LTVICLMEDPDFAAADLPKDSACPIAKKPKNLVGAAETKVQYKALLVQSNQWIRVFCQWRATLVVRSTVP